MARVAATPGPTFPLLVPTGGGTWEGFVTVEDGAGRAHQFWLQVALADSARSSPPLAGATFTPGDHLAALLRDVLPLLHRRLQASTSLASFLTDLQEATRAALDAQHSSGASGDAARQQLQLTFYTALAAEMAALPPGAVSDVSPSLDSLTLGHTDAAGRTHLLRVRLPPDFPHASPVVAAHELPSDDLPATSMTGSTGAPPSTGATLASLLSALQHACARHAALWAALGVLDARCLVVDPPPAEGPPSPKARSRRIALDPALCGMGTTLLVELPPLPQPPGADGVGRGDAIGVLPPVVRLSGPEAAVAPLRTRIAAALAAWRPVGDVTVVAQGLWLYDWLTAAVGHPLPGRPSSDAPPGAGAGDDASTTAGLECGICYSVSLPTVEAAAPDGATTAAVIVPDVWCDNPRCQRAYHTACLADWLREAGAQRSSFTRFFGECPYCKAQISVLVPGEE
jgi:E3 ubiquitin-protein ligase FANCL